MQRSATMDRAVSRDPQAADALNKTMSSSLVEDAQKACASIPSLPLHRAWQLRHRRRRTEMEQRMTFWEAVRLYPSGVGWSLLLSTAIVMEGYDMLLMASFCLFPRITLPPASSDMTCCGGRRLSDISTEIWSRLRRRELRHPRGLADRPYGRRSSWEHGRSVRQRLRFGQVWIQVGCFSSHRMAMS